MYVATSTLKSIGVLAAVIALAACVPTSTPLRTEAPGTVPLTGNRDVVLSAPNGTVLLTVMWPVRRDYRTQAIPLRTNSMTVQVLDPANEVLASTLLRRPQSGSIPTTANLSVLAGPNRRIIVKAYQEETPGFDSAPLAEGSASVTVQPSSEVTADLALVPQDMPAISGIPGNAGPLSLITITGSGFEGWGQPVEVRFGGILSPYVSGSSNQLLAIVPANAEDGPISVTADGLTATSGTSFKVIQGLSLSPQTAVASVGQSLDFALSATDKSGAPIPSPNVTWSFEQTYPLLPPAAGTPPTTLLNGQFTPGSTGSFEVRVAAGSIRATASVTIN